VVPVHLQLAGHLSQYVTFEHQYAARDRTVQRLVHVVHRLQPLPVVVVSIDERNHVHHPYERQDDEQLFPNRQPAAAQTLNSGRRSGAPNVVPSGADSRLRWANSRGPRVRAETVRTRRLRRTAQGRNDGERGFQRRSTMFFVPSIPNGPGKCFNKRTRILPESECAC